MHLIHKIISLLHSIPYAIDWSIAFVLFSIWFINHNNNNCCCLITNLKQCKYIYMRVVFLSLCICVCLLFSRFFFFFFSSFCPFSSTSSMRYNIQLPFLCVSTIALSHKLIYNFATSWSAFCAFRQTIYFYFFGWKYAWIWSAVFIFFFYTIYWLSQYQSFVNIAEHDKKKQQMLRLSWNS